MERKHAFLSPSAADRWMKCPAAPALEHFMPRKENGYMLEGTVAHSFAAAALAHRYKMLEADALTDEAEALAAESGFDTLNMKEHAREYAYYLEELASSFCGDEPVSVMIEHRLTLNDDLFGTADAIIVKGDTIIVADYKYGEGKRVSATDNAQLMTYAVMALKSLMSARDISRVILCIFQPRVEDGASLKLLSAATLSKWYDDFLAPAVSAAMSPVAPCNPGGWCSWCGARGMCSARATAAMATITTGRLHDPRLMTTQQLADTLDIIDDTDVSGWVTDIKAQAEKLIGDNVNIRGWRMAPGASRRFIKDPEGMAAALRVDGVPFEQTYTLRAIGDLERAVGKKNFSKYNDFIDLKTNKPRLVRDEATRKEAARQPFEGIDINSL